MSNSFDERFDKGAALSKMIDGYKVVLSTEISKRGYDNHYCIYHHKPGKFFKIIGKSHSVLDINTTPNKYWQLFKITKPILPMVLYKTDLSDGNIIVCTFKKILKQTISKRNPTVIIEYDGSDGKSYTVKGVFTTYLDIVNDNYYSSMKTARFVLREFVEEESEKQNKRHISKPELKTMKTVRAIIENHPEVLV